MPLLVGQSWEIGLVKSEPALRADQSLAAAQENGRAGRKAVADHIGAELAGRNQTTDAPRLSDASAGRIQVHDLNRRHRIEKPLKILGGSERDAASEFQLSTVAQNPKGIDP